MQQVKKVKTIDLFAGCGGLMDGFEQTKLYETIACVEWEKAPCENLVKRLSQKWGYKDAENRVLRFDIQRIDELINGWQDDEVYQSREGLNHIIKNESIDLIIGGPPCQAYSIAGRIRDEHGMKYDYRNYLFESYIKIVKYYKPKAIIFENVPGMLSAKPNGRPITDEIKEAFNDAGYEIIDNLKEAVIDLSEYGVPQNRKRVIILGLKKNYYKNDSKKLVYDFYNVELPKFKSDNKAIVKEAIGDLPSFTPSKEDYKENGRKYSHFPPITGVSNHTPRYHNKRDIEIFRKLALDISSNTRRYQSTDSLKKLYTEMTGKTSNVHKYFVLRYDEPSNTIPAHLYKDGLRHIHPDANQARSITVREAARLQTFDDDYEFFGSMMEQYKMIGNAVPPKFSNILAKAIFKIIKY